MRISVLMSTYNGERFLREQLDSILAQELPIDIELKILVRDDGSKDSTLDILDEYAKKYSDVLSYYAGENLKPARSFKDLLKNSETSDYYAFSDQDDVWNSDKLARAITLLQSQQDQEIPLLYTSNAIVADAELNHIGILRSEKVYTDLAHMLIYTVSNGCTQVFNNYAREELDKYDMDSNLSMMHDRLADLFTALFGKVIYDNNPTMLYRQHGNNAVGQQSIGKVRNFFKRLRRFLRASNPVRSASCRMFLNLYGDRLDDEQKRLLYAVGYYMTDKQARKTLMRDKAFSKGKKADFLFHWAIRLKKI